MKKAWIMASCSALLMMSVNSQAAEAESPAVAQADAVQPLSPEEVRQGLADMQQRLDQRIKAWGKTLSRDDFEWTWRGRVLNQKKRQEVCNIFQGIVNKTYQRALQNKARLSPADQAVLDERDVFIERLGYKNNQVDTQMGFSCRLH